MQTEFVDAVGILQKRLHNHSKAEAISKMTVHSELSRNFDKQVIFKVFILNFDLKTNKNSRNILFNTKKNTH